MATLTWGAGADVRDQEGPWEFDPDSGIGTITFTDYGQSFSYEEDRITFQGQGGPKPYVCIRAT